MLWVDVLRLKGSEPELTGRCAVTVRSGEHDRHSLLLVELHHLSALVIGCSVLEDDGLGSPVLVFGVQQLQKLTVVHLHDLAV